MNANRSLEHRIADYYSAQAPYRAPDRVLASALTTIERTRQRRVLTRVPWRFTYMSNFARLATAGIAAIAVLAVGWALFVNNQGISSQPTPTPTPTPTAPAVMTPGATPSAPLTESSPSPERSGGAALTETFTSSMFGISASYPAGWRLQRATDSWKGELIYQLSPFADVIFEKQTDTQFIAMASRPLAGQTLNAFADQYLSDVAADGGPCSLVQEPITVDGVAGVVDSTCPIALVATEDRGYVVWLYRNDDRDYFREILATVQLEPSAAVQVSDPFVPAFTFSFPAEAEFDYGSRNETYFEVRVPAFADAGMPSGVIVQAIGAGKADPCDAASEPLEIDPGAQSVIDYLKTIPDLAVTDEAPTTVGGLPAVQATVAGAGDTLACDGIYAWVEETEPFSAVPLDGPRRLVAVDVGSEHVVLTVFGEDGNSIWPAMASQLIDSITFD